MSMHPFAAAALLALGGLAASVPAQGGGFTAHDLYVMGNIGGSPPVGLVRVDPLSGDTAVVSKFIGLTGGYESLAFDPYRQRLILLAQLTPADGPLFRAYCVDAGGQFTPLAPASYIWKGFSATGDGRIYFNDATSTSSPAPFKWLDAANQVHVLYDTDGVTPFMMDGFAAWLDDMIYVPSENALITVTSAPNTPCPGGNGPRLHVRKLPLSADGTRLSGPMSCAEFDVNPTDSETSHGLSLMTDGDVLLGGHSGLYGTPLPRLARIVPSTLATSAFASFGDSSNGGITWSTALGKAVVQAHFGGQLLAYAAGQVDHGVAVTSSGVFTDTRYALDEVPALECDGGWIAYGSGLAGKGGFVPRLYGNGCPEPGASFDLKLDQVVGGAGGALFVGLAPAALPFKGGSLLVAPITLQVAIAVGGAPGVAGVGALTLPASLPSDPGLTGLSIFLQAAFGDGAAVKHVSLTQGLEMEIG